MGIIHALALLALMLQAARGHGQRRRPTLFPGHGVGDQLQVAPESEQQAGRWQQARQSISAPLNCKRLPRNDDGERPSQESSLQRVLYPCRDSRECPRPLCTEPGWGDRSHGHSQGRNPGRQPLPVLLPAAVKPPRSETRAGVTGKPPEGRERAAWQRAARAGRAAVLWRCWSAHCTACCDPWALPAACPSTSHQDGTPHTEGLRHKDEQLPGKRRAGAGETPRRWRCSRTEGQ